MYTLDFISATEKAAIACESWIGRMNSHEADAAATHAMRSVLNSFPISGKVVIGEGEMDEAPMLYIGEEVGKGGHRLDIAVDPLEGTRSTCKGRSNGAMSVLAIAKEGCLLHAPDCYMQKIVVGPSLRGMVDINSSITKNVIEIAKAKRCEPEDITVCLLDRLRHTELIEEIKNIKCKIRLIEDGDILAAIMTCLPEHRLDMLVGSGGSPEGVIAAAAVKSLGGDMQAKLILDSSDLQNRALSMGICDFNKTYYLEDLAKEDVGFFATGVTEGPLLKGVIDKTTHSVAMFSDSKTIKFIKTKHA
jgi:fructose-1,6-bisphosphatase II